MKEFPPEKLSNLCLSMINSYLKLMPLGKSLSMVTTELTVLDHLNIDKEIAGGILLIKCTYFLYAVSAIVVVMSLFWHWQIIFAYLIIIPLIVYIRYLNITISKILMSRLLALDFLTNNIAGWGDQFPGARVFATKLRGEIGSRASSRWLDFFMPYWRNMSAELLDEISP